MSEIRSNTARVAPPGGVAASSPRPGLALLVLTAAQQPAPAAPADPAQPR